jgi:hypothetical protein
MMAFVKIPEPRRAAKYRRYHCSRRKWKTEPLTMAGTWCPDDEVYMTGHWTFIALD